jgi:hypothetical protein
LQAICAPVSLKQFLQLSSPAGYHLGGGDAGSHLTPAGRHGQGGRVKTPFHSITSSARASGVSGTVSPGLLGSFEVDHECLQQRHHRRSAMGQDDIGRKRGQFCCVFANLGGTGRRPRDPAGREWSDEPLVAWAIVRLESLGRRRFADKRPPRTRNVQVGI